MARPASTMAGLTAARTAGRMVVPIAEQRAPLMVAPMALRLSTMAARTAGRMVAQTGPLAADAVP